MRQGGLGLRALYLLERALHVRSDSLLLVQQMLGKYKVKNAGLQPLHGKARLLANETEDAPLNYTAQGKPSPVIPIDTRRLLIHG